MGIPHVKTPDNRGRQCSCEFCLCVAGSHMEYSVQIARGVTMLTSAHPASTPTQHSTRKSALQVSLYSKSKSHYAALFQRTQTAVHITAVCCYRTSDSAASHHLFLGGAGRG